MLQFLVNFVLLFVGIIFLIFNKRIGLFFHNNPLLFSGYPLNARQYALLIGVILILFGLGAFIGQIIEK